MAGFKLKRHALKPEKELSVKGLKVIEPVNDRFTAAADYRN